MFHFPGYIKTVKVFISISVILTVLTFLSCGPDNELVALDFAYRQDGAGRAVQIFSAIFVRSEGAAWQGTHAAGISPSVAPDDPMAMSLCLVLEGGTRGGAFANFRALDLGTVTITGPSSTETLEQQSLETGEGFGYLSQFEANKMPFTPNVYYSFMGSGSNEAPGFEGGIHAPPDFQITGIDNMTVTGGTMPLQRNRDITVTWAPGSEDTTMFIALSNQANGLVCRIRDNGSFTIGKKRMSELGPGRGELVLERIYEEPFETVKTLDGRARPGRARYSVQRMLRFDYQ